MSSSRFSLLALSVLLSTAVLPAQESSSSNSSSSQSKNTKSNNSGMGKTGPAPTTGGASTTVPLITTTMATDPGYRLSLGDEVAIVIHGEDDMSTAQRIDKKGAVRMPIINEVVLGDKTVREAEGFIEQILVERKLLKKPLVNITVRDYAMNEVTFTGRGIQSGVFSMPREVASIEILEIITRHGGLMPNAQADKVRVYRRDESGKENVFVVNYEAMQSSKKNAPKSFLIYPGDRIFVDERLF